MRVVGLLSFFAEKPEHLTAAIGSLAGTGVSHLVACDGAYRLFPGATASSGRECHDAIRDAASSVGMGVTLHVPAAPWQNNEVEKRTVLFRLGHALAQPYDDWLFVLDADEVIEEPGDLLPRLAATDRDVVAILHGEPGVRPRTERRLFRAHPRGITVQDAHYHYVDGDQRVLWGPRQIDRELADDIRVLHRPLTRDKARNKARNAYYEARLLTHAELEV